MFNLKELPFSDLLPSGVCDFSDLQNELINCRPISKIPENAKSVIVFLFPYYLGEEYYKKLNISKYAVSEDYHKICNGYLERIKAYLCKEYKGYKFEWFCDNSPINEVKAAFLAGLGVKGDNALLINKDYGSFCFIGEIITDMHIVCKKNEPEECLKCGLCSKKCPDNALNSSRVVKERCLSHITQKKGELSEKEQSLIFKSGCIWGCDICQDVCPLNRNIKTSPIPEFYENAKATYENLSDYSENRAYSWRKQDVIERNLKILCCKKDENQL